MWCVQYHSPCLVGLSAPTEKNHRHGRNQVFLPSSSSVAELQWRRTSSLATVGLKASVVPPSESGDITGFLQISGGMILLYWIANFVVPDLIYKSLQVDEADEEQDSTD
ncbi:PREDICTED: uncharacterized protein LOC104825405 [Tarenaya hassleriana]|uniref:uncharacterized protein LOC104825405 n=1 Tax=Tarenaya hassleriana TaxID=28532 RepID=UPI00053C7376|nr:PREDICTED: uncharacterized protein LOC104825405 [Tarenaya hassleriana]